MHNQVLILLRIAQASLLLLPILLVGGALADTSTVAAIAVDPETAGLPELLALFESGAIGPAIGVLVMLLLRAAKALSLTRALPAEATRWVAVGLAFLAAIGAALIAGAPWYSAIFGGGVAAVTAIGAHEVVKKKAPAF